MNANYDVLIVGSGFSGSILGWILAKSGLRVAIVDRAQHPRFAIGESSTPTADFLLAYLSDRWSIPELRPLAAWGTWNDTYPHIVAGKKRGFSYLHHERNRPFQDCPHHSQSLMVAASSTDYWSDTHWLRSDVDCFLANRASDAGCELFENYEFEDLSRHSKIWDGSLTNRYTQEKKSIRSRWIIDAAGGDQFSARWLGNQSDDAWMKTRTRAVFSHFKKVSSFYELGESNGRVDPIAGFHVDDAAQHHVTDDGWMWMLRFKNGATSVGIVEQTNKGPLVQSCVQAKSYWDDWISRYPTLKEMLADAVNTEFGDTSFRWSNRLSRCRSHAVGDGWIALPTAYGFVDPLHSTGIAHALSGVMRVAELLVEDSSVDSCRSRRWQEYDGQLRKEIEWLDLLVSGCYRAVPAFDDFCAYAACYFVAAIQFERTMAKEPSLWPNGYMNCNQGDLQVAVQKAYDVVNVQRSHGNQEAIRRLLAPWNDVGLLEPIQGRRIAHTAPPKYANPLSG